MNVQPSVSTLLAQATVQLRAAGIEDPAREARWIAAHVGGAGVDPAGFAQLVGRRAAHEPLAYLLGTAPFWTLTLNVSPATLIPRVDSQTLIDAALAARPDRGAVRRVLDLGTGTGCLLLAALTSFPLAWGLGIDLSAASCRLAWHNAVDTGLAGRCGIVCADWAAPVQGRFDLVVSNPPYIPSRDIAGLMPEVSVHEPRLALDGGADGLDGHRALIASLRPLLAPGGVAIFELGAGQADQVTALAAAAGWDTALRRDSGGHARALMLNQAGG